MPKLIFVNLPVSDLPAAIAFYKALGGEQNQQFSDETGACMVLSDVIHVMLLTHPKFAMFTPKTIADARATSEVLLCLSADSREEVDRLAETAGRSGGKADIGPRQDYGFMYGRSFEDPDGHIWEVMWMDMAAAAQAMAEKAPA